MNTLRERIQAAVMDVLPGIVETELPGGRIVEVELEDDLPDEITDAVMVEVIDYLDAREHS